MKRTTLAIVAASAIIALAPGCSSETPGNPTTSNERTAATGTSTSAKKSSGAPQNGVAPAITEPELSLGQAADSPCDLLNAEQLSSLSVSKPGTASQGASGPQCQWLADSQAKGTNFNGVILKNGLDGLYENKGNFPVFEPNKVQNYPSVDSDLTDAKHGACTTAVGIAKGTAFAIQVRVNDRSSTDYTSPCTVSSRIAELVINNLKGAR
ncbi:DUF3558 domain-containing protein [Goodfellowiella coeruleoviolacea]|uniref:DUF3558 domain-containing protein n=1 Tax=Goodfellowiella coeruleoviolacea TaxID=334858 RepID=A0AAE3GCP8_9PSEU|nr:DUF3558 domain-containing protein [Goodfellowiella coeruleoviolacea]MCP2164985.1 Protein of unknown function (DUF3558) [Goodfellowiella coeruleoviolacea]